LAAPLFNSSRDLALTNLDKVLYPGAAFSKAQVFH
jgi:hypothetical protein